MNNLFLDFETKDTAIAEGLGAGWAYKDKLRIIGYSYAFNDDEVQWSTDLNLLKELISKADRLIAHNASYEVGILLKENIDITKPEIVCTMLQAKIYNSQLMSYSLDYLSKLWVGDAKLKDGLGELAKKLKLVKSKVQNANNIAMKNMDLLYEFDKDLVIAYANQDVELCRKLYKLLYSDKYKYLSDLIKSVCKSRFRGVRVDLDKLKSAKYLISQDMNVEKIIMNDYLKGRNPRSGLQMAEVCDENDIKYPKTSTGRPSFAKGWDDGIDHPLCNALKKYKTLDKLRNDFIIKIENMVTLIYGEQELKKKTSRIYPEINILGATATGRFSASNPNMQNIPKRNEMGKKYARGIFIPEEGHKWYCLDFSSQESRMQVHFANRVGSSHGKKMAEMWTNNPNFDMHTEVAQLIFNTKSVTKEQRTMAKTINLGASYGMGMATLALSLKISLNDAKILLDKYNNNAPYLKDLTTVAKSTILNVGYLNTLLGRKVHKPKTQRFGNKVQDFSYKAINYLIQGSSADQISAAMVIAYREGIDILFPVHDELTISTNDINKVIRLKEIMETAIPLTVPSQSEVTVGDNFADQTPIDFKEVSSVRFNR